MRSEEYPTLYRVGVLNGAALYWHPGGGFALQRGPVDGPALQGVAERELVGVDWFGQLEDFTSLSEAITESGGRLLGAMPTTLRWAFVVVQWAVEDEVTA